MATNPIIEAGARAACDVWGYLWDAPPDDPQATGTGELYDDRPTKRLYRITAAAVYLKMVDAMTDKQIRQLSAVCRCEMGTIPEVRAALKGLTDA